MKKIKCGLFLFIGYPNKHDCDNTIMVSDNLKEASKQMNAVGWRKCGRFGVGGGWGYFCPDHAEANQFYIKKGHRKT